MNDFNLRQLFYLCKEKNKFVYEVCDVFGDRLSIEETEYWYVFNIISSASVYDVNISHMSLESAVEEIKKAERKRKLRWQSRSKKSSSKKPLSMKE